MPPYYDEEDDFPSYLRKRTIFDSPPTPTTWFRGNLFNQPSPLDNSANTEPSEKAASDFATAYKAMMNVPEGQAQARYRRFLGTELPSKEQYKPGVINRIGAILSGLSTGITHGAGQGFATAQGILDEPYQEALSRYKMQGGRLGEAARIENEDILNKVKLTRDILESQDRQAREARQAKLDAARIIHYGRLDQIAVNWKPVGNSYLDLTTGIRSQNMQNPLTGEIRRIELGKSGRSTTEAINFEGAREKAREAARSPFAEQRQKEVQDAAMERELARERAAKELKGIPGVAPIPAPITTESTTDITRKPASFWHGTPETTTRKTTITRKPTAPSTAPKKIEVVAPDGRRGFIDEGELAEAKKNGWKETGKTK